MSVAEQRKREFNHRLLMRRLILEEIYEKSKASTSIEIEEKGLVERPYEQLTEEEHNKIYGYNSEAIIFLVNEGLITSKEDKVKITHKGIITVEELLLGDDKSINNIMSNHFLHGKYTSISFKGKELVIEVEGKVIHRDSKNSRFTFMCDEPFINVDTHPTILARTLKKEFEEKKLLDAQKDE